jgi:hypothetical protein
VRRYAGSQSSTTNRRSPASTGPIAYKVSQPGRPVPPQHLAFTIGVVIDQQANRLFLATILSFLLVGAASSADRKRDTAAMILFALVFAAVLIVIIDLDRPQEGLLTVPQTAMTDLLRQITPW